MRRTLPLISIGACPEQRTALRSVSATRTKDLCVRLLERPPKGQALSGERYRARENSYPPPRIWTGVGVGVASGRVPPARRGEALRRIGSLAKLHAQEGF